MVFRVKHFLLAGDVLELDWRLLEGTLVVRLGSGAGEVIGVARIRTTAERYHSTSKVV